MAGRVVAVIGARLNSSRLPRKHLLHLASEPLIAHVVDRLRHVPEIDQVVLATTADDYNHDLVTWAADYGVACHAFDGDVNDLMGRVNEVVVQEDADIILYVCGDCPLIDMDTVAALLRALKDAPDAEVSKLTLPNGSQGTIHVGFDIVRRSFWNRMYAASSTADEREHVGAAWHHSKKVEPAAIAYANDAEVFSSIRHRISVDTAQDYYFMRRVYEDWYACHDQGTPVALEWVVDRLTAEPELRAINADVHQRGVSEDIKEIALLSEVGPEIGLGHLSRICVAAFALQATMGARVRLFIRGQVVPFESLNLLPHTWVDGFQSVSDEVLGHDAVIVDLKEIDQDASTLMARCEGNVYRVGIDRALHADQLFDFLWVPSVYLPEEAVTRLGAKLQYGLDCMLLRQPFLGNRGQASEGTAKRVVILTGGSDPAGLAQVLPEKLLAALHGHVQITWVQGPYAATPNVGSGTQASPRWTTAVSPPDLHQFVVGFDAALCVFGVSFYECLNAHVPTIVFDPLKAATAEEWQFLKKQMPDFVMQTVDDAVSQLASMMQQAAPAEIPAAADRLQGAQGRFARLVQEKLQAHSRGALHNAS
ncbi:MULTISPECIES: cytidylyltransferase domain-containing protein [Kordiimonas]|uniref:cytidylyltransferase domain-containing protein n=1 Tax=Kordiimonas TaxID=288021 RepID=UPI00257E70BC|nr:NTP transferase domain-containing protein [Kordiimonas sp. UBA4487]